MIPILLGVGTILPLGLSILMALANSTRSEEETPYLNVSFMDLASAVNPLITFYMANFNLIGNYIASFPDMQVEVPPEFREGGDESEQEFGGMPIFGEDGEPIDGVVTIENPFR